MLELESKFKELFPKAKVTITNLGIEYSSSYQFCNYKYRVTITNNSKVMWFIYHDSVYNYNNRKNPSLYDVLSSVVQDSNSYYNTNSISNFIEEYSYSNKKEGKKAYYSCRETYSKLIRVLTKEGLNNLCKLVENY